MTFTRRNFLLSSGVLASAAYLAAGQVTAARAEGGPLVISPLAESPRSIDVPGAGFASLTTLPFPSGFTLTSTATAVALPAFMLAVSFDNRVFEAGEFLIASGQEVTASPLAGAPGVAGPITTVHFDVASLGPVSTAEIFLPLTPRALYPAEAVDSPQQTMVELVPASGPGVSASWAPIRVLDGTTAWGAELDVVWAETTVTTGASAQIYRYPRLVTITSVGPGAIPAGAEVLVDVDPRLIADLQFSSIKSDSLALPSDAFVSTAVEAQGSRRLSFLFQSAIPAGAVVEIEVVSTVPDDTPVIAGLLWATARMSAPGDDLSFQRSTGLYEVVDLTDSGAPLVEGVAKGTV